MDIDRDLMVRLQSEKYPIPDFKLPLYSMLVSMWFHLGLGGIEVVLEELQDFSSILKDAIRLINR
jgi:hypothetical protein